MSETTYEIVRYHKYLSSQIIQTGLTLEQAQEWCNRDDTHGDDWFDGYREE
jgi:hypothetical protein